MGFSEAGRLLAALLLVCSVVGAVPAGGGAGGRAPCGQKPQSPQGHRLWSEAGLETRPRFSLTV